MGKVVHFVMFRAVRNAVLAGLLWQHFMAWERGSKKTNAKLTSNNERLALMIKVALVATFLLAAIYIKLHKAM